MVQLNILINCFHSYETILIVRLIRLTSRGGNSDIIVTILLASPTRKRLGEITLKPVMMSTVLNP